MPIQQGPSTAFHAVPLPIAFGDREDWSLAYASWRLTALVLPRRSVSSS
ncbi:MAG: hypothetical protein QOH86_1872 [Sphingomonadales bacterium]|nr:hypothetical protein [Sphingomonadales bacterium]